MSLSSFVNNIVGSTGVGQILGIDDITGVEGAQDAANQAASIQAEGARTAEEGINRRFDITQAGLQPRIDAGNQAVGQQQALLGLSGQDAQSEAFQAFNDSPGQKFMRDRARKQRLRSADSMGGIGGGNIRAALSELDTGFAQQDFNNRFGRLGQIAGQGQNAATNVGQFGATAANQAGNAAIAGSQARASGILGSAQAESQFNSNVFELGGMALGGFLGA